MPDGGLSLCPVANHVTKDLICQLWWGIARSVGRNNSLADTACDRCVCADDLEEFSIVEDGGNDGIEVVIEPVVDGTFSSALTPGTQVLTWPLRESFLLTLVFNIRSKKKCRLGEEEHDQ